MKRFGMLYLMVCGDGRILFGVRSPDGTVGPLLDGPASWAEFFYWMARPETPAALFQLHWHVCAVPYQDDAFAATGGRRIVH